MEVARPAVVTISNEIGDPRYPTASAKVKARRVKPTVVTPADLNLDEAQLHPRVMLTKQFVPEVQGNCEFLQGRTRRNRRPTHSSGSRPTASSKQSQ